MNEVQFYEELKNSDRRFSNSIINLENYEIHQQNIWLAFELGD
jgi:hypothetical protein